MRIGTSLLILAAGIAISVAAWAASGGRLFLVFLPLVFGLPLLWRRR
ncbi:hypothetical protein [Phenylobacterium zucineum]|nr:hypothetical protein [Phenylobacterium zucineum]